MSDVPHFGWPLARSGQKIFRAPDKSGPPVALVGCVDNPGSQRASDGLLAELAAGREEAFARLYDQFGERLYRTARTLTGRREDAEDAVQETFAALVRSRGSLPSVRDLQSYLFTVLRRAASRRASETRKLKLFESSHEPPAPEAADLSHAVELRQALEQLPSEQREVVALKIDAQLTFAQIASVLEINANTAASRYRYALERLREILKD